MRLGTTQYHQSTQPPSPEQPSPQAAQKSKTVQSDALVYFGATSDIAYKQVFTALQRQFAAP